VFELWIGPSPWPVALTHGPVIGPATAIGAKIAATTTEKALRVNLMLNLIRHTPQEKVVTRFHQATIKFSTNPPQLQ
jgi:hypothetical protein